MCVLDGGFLLPSIIIVFTSACHYFISLYFISIAAFFHYCWLLMPIVTITIFEPFIVLWIGGMIEKLRTNVGAVFWCISVPVFLLPFLFRFYCHRRRFFLLHSLNSLFTLLKMLLILTVDVNVNCNGFEYCIKDMWHGVYR